MITFPKQKTVEANRTFRAWKTYHGMYLHFTGSYDYFKYFGNATWGTIASMEKYFAKYEHQTGFSWQRGFFASLTGAMLLGWSGGGFIGVGDTYLFLTIAAVVIGGTSLLGGYGGYGLSVIGVLVLQIITTVLVGWGLSWQGQQFILGLLIIPMVALYARSPHIRSQI